MTPATVTNERKVLGVEGKVTAIQIENGNNKADVCREFVLVSSAIQTICNNRTKIISVFEQNG